MNLFNIDWDALRAFLVPTILRKERITAFIKVLMAPIVWLHGWFRYYREKDLYRLNHRQHVAHLQAVLNDLYDAGFKRIKIVPAVQDFEPLEIYQKAEAEPVYFRKTAEGVPQYLFGKTESETGGFDFVIEMPITIPYVVEEMIAIVNKYKRPGVGFIIQEV